MLENKIKSICEEVFCIKVSPYDLSSSKDYVVIGARTVGDCTVTTVNKLLQIVLGETGCTGSFMVNREGLMLTFLKPLVENEYDIT